ncbi:hypothetical protein [Enterobacter sp. 262D3]|uniref:hypothetical protein n=1 Tax=Enterobacter sp. 262D3 TaxID=3077763 RepID=UPI002A7EBE4E|nr:hypothetical protein [Enterobacter sp. 262D3]
MNTSFPACQKNGQPYPGVDQMMDVLLREPHGSWLAGTNTMWHGGIHLSEVSAPGSVLTPETADSAVPLRFMAGGEVVAWRLNQDYLSGDYMGNALQYSSTFVLVKSTCTPDPEKPDNALDFYALYMGLAPLSAFPVNQIYQVTERGNRLRKRQHSGQEKPGEQAPAPDGGHLTAGDRVVVLRENTFELNGVPQRFGLARMLNGKSEMNGAAFWVSLDPVFMAQDGEQRAHLPAWMQQAITQGAYDAVVAPATKCVVAAGDAVGYLAEDIAPDGMHGVEKSAFVHIELLSTDSRMRDFLNNTAQVKSGQTYIHIHPESFLYERSGDIFTRTDGHVKKDIHQILPQDKCHPFTDSNGKRWFTLGEGAWLSESDVDADIAQYDLMKLGFSAFEEPPTSDMTQSLHEGWIKSAFTQLAEWVRPERGIQEKQVSTWYKAILRKMDSDSSGDLSGAELYHAVHFPEMDVRDIAARMVVKHDSEWFGGSQHHRWKTFLQRTDRLYVSYVRQWFDDLEWMSQVPEFSRGEPVWHMHPVVFLEALRKQKKQVKGWAHSPFAELLGRVESNNDYTAYNQILTQPYYRTTAKYKTNLTSMTVKQVMDAQKDRSTMFATGRFQIIPGTLKDAVKKLNINVGELYDETMQNYIFEEYLIKIKRKPIIDYLEGDGSAEDAAYAWAKEFASAGVRKGRAISKGRVAEVDGVSYYAGDGLNTAHIMPDDMVKALVDSKK